MSQEKLTLTIPSIFGYENFLVEAVGTVGRVKDYPFEKISKLKTAVTEVCVNAIEHGNKLDPNKDVVMTIECESSRMLVSVRDFGEGYEPPPVQKPDIKKQIEEKNLGGWGMYLIHTLVDEVNIEAVPNQSGLHGLEMADVASLGRPGGPGTHKCRNQRYDEYSNFSVNVHFIGHALFTSSFSPRLFCVRLWRIQIG